ncbi:MAG: Bro-N domain-containing protein [Bacteroidales bacterium]|nr:Bro-N domain-containing protein [Bacteroidales bacterium]
MTQQQAIQLFEQKRVRTVWDDDQEKWYFSIVDVVEVLTESSNPQTYWRVLKNRLKKEGNETVTNCNAFKFRASDGKMRLTDVADTEQLFRLIQSIPSPKAEPFKQWMAEVAAKRIDQLQDPELSIEQAVADYRRLGYSEAWINQRMKSIEVRKHLTDEWKRAGVTEGQQFASLTDIIYREWSGLSAKEYKRLKGLKKENLRDNMTDLEIAINMLAEATTTQISKNESPNGMAESAGVAKRGGAVAKHARKAVEKEIGQSVVSPMNAKQIAQGETELPSQRLHGIEAAPED